MKQVITILLILSSLSNYAQSFTEKISKELSFDVKSKNNTIIIANINGHIRVIGYEGDKVQVEITRTITAKTGDRLDTGKSLIKPGVLNRADTLILFTEGLCSSFGRLKDRNVWGYQWRNQNDDCMELADFEFDYVVKVPYSINVVLSTVNNGDISVENSNGLIKADNVNGSIYLTNVTHPVNASTVNGDVDVTYSLNPDKDCRFYTLNGNVNAWFPKGLSATMSFESFNGELFTNVPKLESLPVMLEKSQNARGTKFKVSGNQFKVGSGGVLLDFETFNGNVYVKEKI